MGIVQKLSPHIADLIAAGEVVERPAAAIKEMLENSIDAKANAITVEIKRGGASLMRVTDNGIGLSSEDAIMAFERHATSKIKTKDDLFSVATLGFRGEALAAIAAVSRIDLMTRQQGNDVGFSVNLAAGHVMESSEIGCPEGSTIVVRDLFFNTPARQKFLKKDNTESGHVHDVVLKAALSHPEICFKLIKDGNEVLHTPGDNTLSSAIYSLFGADFARGLIKVNYSRDDVAITGFAGKTELARSTRNGQYFFVNGRPVRSRTLLVAFEEPYENDMPSGKAPVGVLHITIPPDQYDINVHPAKAEIKFINEKKLFDTIYFAVKSALQNSQEKPELKIPQTAILGFQQTKSFNNSQISADLTLKSPQLSFNNTLTSSNFEQPTNSLIIPEKQAVIKPFVVENTRISNIQKTQNTIPLQHLNIVENIKADETQNSLNLADANLQDWRFVGEVLGGYLVVETEKSIFLIDKHAAHERILFENWKEKDYQPMMQQLLTPVTVVLSAGECSAILNEQELLKSIGFSIDVFGGNSLIVRAAPHDIETESFSDVLGEIAKKLVSGSKNVNLRDDIFHMIACKAAIKVGKKGNEQDMLMLVKKVMETPELRHCPHGRPITIRLTQSQLERQFGR